MTDMMAVQTVTSISETVLMSNTTDSLSNSSSSASPQQYVSLPPTLLLLLVLLLYLPVILTTVTGDLLLLASVARAPKLRTPSNACLINLAVSRHKDYSPRRKINSCLGVIPHQLTDIFGCRLRFFFFP